MMGRVILHAPDQHEARTEQYRSRHIDAGQAKFSQHQTVVGPREGDLVRIGRLSGKYGRS